MKPIVFIFNSLKIAVELEGLMKSAGITEIEYGETYDIKESPLYIFDNKFNQYRIETFRIESGGLIPGTLFVTFDTSSTTEYEADWLVTSDLEVAYLQPV